MGLFPGLGRSPGVKNDNPLQYSCLENSMDRGTWQATGHEVAKHRTLCKGLSKNTHTQMYIPIYTHKYVLSCITDHPQTQQLETTTTKIYYLTQFPWVRNSVAFYVGGSGSGESLRGLKSRCWPESLTEAGGSISLQIITTDVTWLQELPVHVCLCFTFQILPEGRTQLAQPRSGLLLWANHLPWGRFRECRSGCWVTGL